MLVPHSYRCVMRTASAMLSGIMNPLQTEHTHCTVPSDARSVVRACDAIQIVCAVALANFQNKCFARGLEGRYSSRALVFCLMYLRELMDHSDAKQR